MSDSKGKAGWTDRQRLAYFVSLVEYSNVKLDYTNAPRPEGKSVGACQIMIHRLKATLKDDLEALRSGTAMPEDSPKKTPTTPRKRKTNDAAVDGDDAGSGSTKRGRKKKNTVETTTPESMAEHENGDDEEEFKVKMEVNGDLD